nr:type II restriction endonuclease [uncultured Dethiosulfovibrio sp.]
MKISSLFSGFFAKYLSSVDANPRTSNQHEINSNKMTVFLGTPEGEEKVYFEGNLIYIPEKGDPLFSKTVLTWYDTRAKNEYRSAEYRLYYANCEATQKMSEGDFIVIARRKDITNEVVIAITPRESSAEQQLRYLFGIEDTPENIQRQPVSKDLTPDKRDFSFVEDQILQAIGIEIQQPLLADLPSDILEKMIDRFNGSFPKTKDFSEFARSTLEEVTTKETNPDKLFTLWFEREELLFRKLEEYIVSQRIGNKFKSVDDFISYSLSVHNRRKSRAGYAAENHLEAIFIRKNIHFSRGQTTEGKSKPDFIFPGISEYRDNSYPSAKLTMLGSKTTCKDRWRQILTEAERIPHKHLFTIQPSITTEQTDEMKASNVSLVLPLALHKTYKEKQQKDILSLGKFIEEVISKR